MITGAIHLLIPGSKLWLFFMLIMLPLYGISAQEICNNGIDDDGDSLVDINDPDCVCGGSQFQILSTDFEEMTCCPMNFTGGSEPGIGCLVGWSQASNGTTDYHHTCGYVGGVLVPFMPLPPPSGEGAVGFITRDGYQEYVGICMPNSMMAGETYTVEMYVGFNSGPFPPFSYESNSPFEIGIFGTTSCDNYPANISSCISNIPSWSLIGTQSVSGEFGEWVFTDFTITPTEDFAAIAIGGSCNASAQDSQYHFIDDVAISGNFMGEGMPLEIALAGNCISGVVLSVDEVPGATYQWYLDGVAIDGATDFAFTVPGGDNGTFNILIDDGNGCVISEDLEVDIETNVLDVVGEVNDVSCVGYADGSIELDLPMTNEPITVLWETGEMTASRAGLEPGSYTVTITDDNGCTGEETFEVSEPDEPLTGVIIDIGHPVFPTTQGSAQVGGMGGTPGYTYLWDDGQTTSSAILLPGTHTVTITDLNGCEEIVTVSINPVLALNSIVQNDPCPNTCAASIELLVTGGMPSYDYTWSDGNTGPFNFELCAGIYFVTITDNSGTEIMQDIEIAAPDALIIAGQVMSGLCAGETGTIALNVSGGTPGYLFNWSNGEETSMITDLEPGNYLVTVTDESGCSEVEVFVISAVDSIEIIGEVTDESCGGGSDGSINITVFNGTMPYTYTWSNGFTGEDPVGLDGDVYAVTVTDANGCESTATYTIMQGGDLVVVPSSQPASCEGVADGAAGVMVEGGTSPYTYSWSNGSTGPSVSDVEAGTYSVTITDSGDCETMESITIDSGSGVEIVLDATGVRCAGDQDGAIDLSATEGTGILQYAWSNGQSTEDISDLASGTYSVIVTDTNGCEAHDTIDILAPLVLMASATITQASCTHAEDGSISLEISGGTGSYTVMWSTGVEGLLLDGVPAGVYSVMIADANNCELDTSFTIQASDVLDVSSTVTPASCNGGTDGTIDLVVSGGQPPYNFLWSTGATTEDLQGLAPGMYHVSITDVAGCVQTADVIVSGAGSMAVQAVISGISCNGENDGAIDITVSGGMGPLMFSWSNGATTEDLDGVGTSIYMVTITDANGCVLIGAYEIENISPLDAISVPTDASCFGNQDGMIQIMTMGGTAPYAFQWSNGASTEDLAELSAGQYTLMITDANGCTFTSSVDIAEPDILDLTILNIVPPGSVGERGSARVEVAGGTKPYTIQWSNGEMGATATLLDIGITTVVVTDSNGCTGQAEVEITIEPLSVSTDIVQNACYDECEGQIAVTIAGGLSPYSFTWSNGETTPTISGLCSGLYAVTVTDGVDNSVITEMIEIVNPPELVLNSEITGVSCVGKQDGSIMAVVEGGTTPYMYIWDTGSAGELLTNLGPGSYTITVTDVNGCMVSTTYAIDDIQPLDLVVHTTDIDCNNPSGTILIEGNNPDQYSILINGEDFGVSTGEEVTGLLEGTYTIEYEINAVCRVVVDTVDIVTVSDFNVEITPSAVEVVPGGQVLLGALISGTISNYTINWTAAEVFTCLVQDSLGNCLIIGLEPEQNQIVALHVVDGLGCEDDNEAVIRLKISPGIYAPNVFSPNGDGINDVFKPAASDPETYVRSFRIYNRWGGLIHEETNLALSALRGWNGFINGSDSEPGVFVYFIEVDYPDGILEVLTGDVTLVR